VGSIGVRKAKCRRSLMISLIGKDTPISTNSQRGGRRPAPRAKKTEAPLLNQKCPPRLREKNKNASATPKIELDVSIPPLARKEGWRFQIDLLPAKCSNHPLSLRKRTIRRQHVCSLRRDPGKGKRGSPPFELAARRDRPHRRGQPVPSGHSDGSQLPRKGERGGALLAIVSPGKKEARPNAPGALDSNSRREFENGHHTSSLRLEQERKDVDVLEEKEKWKRGS